MNGKRLMILGAGGYGKTVADVAAQIGYGSVAFLDDGKTGEEILGKCGDFPRFLEENTDFYPAFGSNEARMGWMGRLKEAGASIPTLIHPRAYVSPKAEVEVGSVVLPMAVVNTGVRVGMGCIVNIGVLIDHDSHIGQGVHLCPGVVVKAENRIAPMSRLESGTIVMARQYPL